MKQTDPSSRSGTSSTAPAQPLPRREVQRRRRVAARHHPRAQPHPLDPAARHPRHDTADQRRDLPAAAAHHPRPAHPHSPTLHAAPARPLALAARLRRLPRATPRPPHAHVTHPGSVNRPGGRVSLPDTRPLDPEREPRALPRKRPTSTHAPTPTRTPHRSHPSENGGLRLKGQPVGADLANSGEPVGPTGRRQRWVLVRHYSNSRESQR
jgi:hypothetical protein